MNNPPPFGRYAIVRKEFALDGGVCWQSGENSICVIESGVK